LSDTFVVFPLMIIGLGLTMPIGPWLIKYIPAQLIISCSAFLALAGVFLSSFTTSLNLFIFLYAVWFSVGIGVAYLVPLVCGWEFYRAQKGMVSGIVIGGFGFGSFAFSYVWFAIANPNNETPEEKVEGGTIFSIHQPESENAPRMLRVWVLLWMVLR
jgi:OFA family oxalate/formate antiporter-like MFS transporter